AGACGVRRPSLPALHALSPSAPAQRVALREASRAVDSLCRERIARRLRRGRLLQDGLPRRQLGGARTGAGRADGVLVPHRRPARDRSVTGAVPRVRGAHLLPGLLRRFTEARRGDARIGRRRLPLRLGAGARASLEPRGLRERLPASAPARRATVGVHGLARARGISYATTRGSPANSRLRAGMVPRRRKAARARRLTRRTAGRRGFARLRVASVEQKANSRAIRLACDPLFHKIWERRRGGRSDDEQSRATPRTGTCSWRRWAAR